MNKFKKKLFSTVLCIRFPFLKHYNTKDKFFQETCWYYSVNPGWRRLALQMFEEIRSTLKREGKPLNSFRIYDVKEKYGELVVDCSGGYNDDVTKIIEKYEYISFRTCNVCGRPAFGYTDKIPWMLPYCEDCAPRNTPIHKFGTENDHWYDHYSLLDKGNEPIVFSDEKIRQ